MTSTEKNSETNEPQRTFWSVDSDPKAKTATFKITVHDVSSPNDEESIKLIQSAWDHMIQCMKTEGK